MIKYTNGFTVCFNDPKVGRKCLETLVGLLPVLKREKDFYLHATYYDEGMKLPGTIAREAMKAGVAARRKGWQNWLILVFPDFAELDADSWKDEDSYQVPEPCFISLSRVQQPTLIRSKSILSSTNPIRKTQPSGSRSPKTCSPVTGRLPTSESGTPSYYLIKLWTSKN